MKFIRRFLLHVLPRKFHRIRYTGFFANGNRAANLALARMHLNAPIAPEEADVQSQEADRDEQTCSQPCPHCGGPMIVIETFEPGQQPRYRRARDPPFGRAQEP